MKNAGRQKLAKLDAPLRRGSPQRRSHSPAVAPLAPGQDVIEGRFSAWAAGRDDEGPLCGALKNCCGKPENAFPAIADVRARSWAAPAIEGAPRKKT